MWKPARPIQFWNPTSRKNLFYSVAVTATATRRFRRGNGEVYLWDLESNSELGHLEGHDDEETEVNGIALHSRRAKK